MNDKNKPIIIGTILLIACVIILVVIMSIKGNSNTDTNSFKSSGDVKRMVKSIYNELGDKLPELAFQNVDTSLDSLKSYTGLSDNSNIDFMVVSEPEMNAQAYSLVALKVKDASKIESMKQEMYDNIDMAKWICVSAEKLYITNSGDLIFMVMSVDEWATPVYNNFKKYVNNNIGKELTKDGGENIKLPDELLQTPEDN